MSRTVTTPLAPGQEFTGVDHEYSKVLRLGAMAALAVEAVALGALLFFLAHRWPWLWGLIPLTLLIHVPMVVFARRIVSAMGYFEGPDDLLFCYGRMKRGLKVIPYGRMQEINVEEGPIMRRYGLAKITFVTASAAANVGIPGLRSGEAQRLRLKLTELGSVRMEGL